MQNTIIKQVKAVLLELNQWILLILLTTPLLLISCLGGEEPFDTAAQFDKEQKLIDEFIISNNLASFVQVDSSGFEVRYVMLTSGSGESPKEGDWMYLDYDGLILPSGETFDSFDSVYIQLNANLLVTWQLLMPYVHEGGKILMMSPSYYAFGRGGSANGKVPANTPVGFEVNLRGVYDQFGYEQKLVEDYLRNNELVAESDTATGMYFVISEQGTGEYATATDTVNVDYSGSLLSTGEVFDQADSIEFVLSRLISGWRILMPYLREGGSMKMFIPSEYAYGRQGAGDIPANSTLIFDVKLNSIE